MKKRKLIPFYIMPGSWGLSGKAYKEAEAYYYFDGEELERELANIKYETKDEIDMENTRIDLSYGKIDLYEYELRILEIETKDIDSDEYKLGKLEIDYKLEKISKNTYEKETANIKNEPWVGILDNGFDPEKGLNGVYFELDWNDQWIEFLKQNGYSGYVDEQIVEQWFSDVCKQQYTETVSKEFEQNPPFNSSRVINKISGKNKSSSEYS